MKGTEHVTLSPDVIRSSADELFAVANSARVRRLRRARMVQLHEDVKTTECPGCHGEKLPGDSCPACLVAKAWHWGDR